MKAAALALLLIVTSASGQDVVLPDVVVSARKLNLTRQSRIKAEIALQASIVDSRQMLLDEGYSTPWEVDVAKTELEGLQALERGILAYDVLLRDVVEAFHGDSLTAPRARWVAIAIPDSIAQFSDGANMFWFVAHDSELCELSAQIAVLRREAQGELRALEAEATYISETINRLRRIDDRSVSTTREIELNEMKLAVTNSRLAMTRAQQEHSASLEQLHEQSNRVGFPIELKNETFDNSVQLADFLQRTWQVHRTRAQRTATEARSVMLSQYQARAMAIESEQLSTATWWTRTNTRNALELNVRKNHTPAWPDQTGATAHAITLISKRVTRLTELAAADAISARELEHALQELAVLRAHEQIELETDKLQELATHFAQASYLAVTHTASASTPSRLVGKGYSADVDRIVLACYEFAANRRGDLDLATSQVSLQLHKLAGLQNIRKLGYATWKEIAQAERDLAVAKAQQLTALEQLEIARLEYQRAKQVIDARPNVTNSVAVVHE